MTTLKQGVSIRNRFMNYAARLRFPKLVLLTAMILSLIKNQRGQFKP